MYYSEQAAALVAAGGSVVSLLLVFLLIPHIPKKVVTPSAKRSAGRSLLSPSAILRLFSLPGVTLLLLIKTVCGVPIGILQSMFSVVAMEQFKLPADQNGLLMSYIGVVSIFMQGIGISFATRWLSDRSVLLMSTVLLGIAYFTLVST